MGIFSATRRIFDNARMDLDYPAFEKSARSLHQAAAERRFSTRELYREIQVRMSEPERVAESRFNARINTVHAVIAKAERKLAEQRKVLGLLLRDYGAELAPLYKTKADIFDKLAVLKELLDSAYTDQSDASDSLDRWYAKSDRSFFGNGGRELPRHSLFGQSLADRDCLKNERDNAGDDIADCKEQRDELRRKIAQVKENLSAVKADQQRMSALRQSGFSRQRMELTIQQTQGLLVDAAVELKQLREGMATFILAAKHSTGTASLEARVAEVETLRREYVAVFDAPQAAGARRLSHRREWLRAHGRSAG